MLKNLFCVMLSLSWLSSCATVQGTAETDKKYDDAARTYGESFEEVVVAARTSFAPLELKVEIDRKTDATHHMFVTRKGASGWSWGEIFRVTVEKLDDGKTGVSVLSRRKVITNWTATNFTEPFFAELEKRLKAK